MRIVFVTGTDTGVGKTVVTSLLLARLISSGANVRALKPFCSGDRTDAVLLWELQDRKVALETINPFYFTEPLSPWTAARRSGTQITIDEVASRVGEQAGHCDTLLVEGAGGLFSPLGEGFNAADLIRRLGAEVIIVAPNRLGVLNHVLLNVEALVRRDIEAIRIALTAVLNGEVASQTNNDDLRLLLPSTSVVRIPFLTNFRPEASFVRSQAANIEALL